MHKCDQADCKHKDVEYCAKCRNCYCKVCDFSWEEKCKLWHGYYYHTPTYAIGTATGPTIQPQTGTFTCSHTDVGLKYRRV